VRTDDRGPAYGAGGADRPEKVFVIPHGAADNRVIASSPAGGARRKVLTWGLLGPGKGIEHAIDAMAVLRGRGLRAEYQVAGQTHPRVLDRDGEAYRQALMARARDREVADRVHFDARYLPADALGRLISSADVVLLPYDSPEQVTSGVLIEAVAAGKPVVSTRFPHAVELLRSGAGLLVDRQDPADIARARGGTGRPTRSDTRPTVTAGAKRSRSRRRSIRGNLSSSAIAARRSRPQRDG
jgi:polysaccharide biosynthesis protein PslF